MKNPRRLLFILPSLALACGSPPSDDDVAHPDDEAADELEIVTVTDYPHTSHDSTIETLPAHEMLERLRERGVPEPGESELGTLTQALFSATLGYGSLANTNRCGPSPSTWPGDKCGVPLTKTLRVFATCDNCTQEQFDGFQLGKAIFGDSVQIEGGFSISFVQTTENVRIRVAPVPPTSQGDPLGDAATTSRNSNDITPSTNRTYRRTHFCDARLDFNQVAATPGLTSAQRVNAYAALFLHEAGHCIGLGHINCTGSSVMCTFGPKTTSGGYQSVEYGWLNSYSPT